MFDCELFGNLRTLHKQNIYFQNTYFPVQHHKAMKVIIRKSFYITFFSSKRFGSIEFEKAYIQER